MTITHQTVLDEEGKPVAAQIPWEQFLHICKELEDEKPTQEEIDACMEAEKDRREGNADAFVPLEEVKAKLGL